MLLEVVLYLMYYYNDNYSNQLKLYSKISSKEMQKMIMLPKISIKEMEEKVKNRFSTNKLSNIQQSAHSIRNNDIKITSPFYDRINHNGKCQCQYHRMKRIFQQSRMRFQKGIPNYQAHFQKDHKGTKQNINNCTKLTPIPGKKSYQGKYMKSFIPYSLITQNSNNEYEDSVEFQHDKQGQSNTQNSNIYNINSMIKSKTHIDNDNVNCKIKHINQQYLNLISRRLQNDKYKQKYLKTLFHFMTMKTNQNKFYMYESKGYIKNSLNMLLNHFKMEKLIQVNQLSEEQISRIAYCMNCKSTEKVKGVLHSLGNAISQMNQLLNTLKNRAELANSSKNQQESKYSKKNLDEATQNMSSKKMNRSFLLKNQLSEHQSTRSSILQNLSSTNHSMGIPDQQTQNLRSSSKKEYIKFSKRRPTRRFGLLQMNGSKDINAQANINGQISKRNSRLSHYTRQSSLNRSIRTTALGVVDEQQKQNLISKKQAKVTKLKRIIIEQRYKDIQINEKYKGIKYQPYLSKAQFISLIEQMQRLNQNDLERAQFFCRLLKIEGFLDDVAKIERIIKEFQPLLSDNIVTSLLQHIVLIRDKRYIEKLQRQLDDILVQIRRNDPRQYNDDIIPARGERKGPKGKNFREYKPERQSNISKIIYYQANEQIDRHKQKEKTLALHLEQAQLNTMRLQTIDPSLSQIIHHFSTKKAFALQKMPIHTAIDQQKRILKYMKQNHCSTFHYLQSSISKICKSLQKQSDL